MTTKKKIASAVTAVAVASAVTVGTVLLSNDTEVTTPTVTEYEEYVENSDGNITVSEETQNPSLNCRGDISEQTDTEIIPILSGGVEETTPQSAEPTAPLYVMGSLEDVLAPYRTTIEKDGKILYYYKDVPFELQGYLIGSNGRTGTDVTAVIPTEGESEAYDLSDISVMSNYIFVNTADGLKYLSDISNGNITDEQIENADFTDYNVFINAYLGDVTQFVPFKEFNGFFYGNDFEFALDNYLFENFGGMIEAVTITSNKAVAKVAKNAEIKNCNFYITSTSDTNGVIEVGNSVKMKNIYAEVNLSGSTVGGLMGIASGESDIKNCIVYGSLSADDKVGSYIGKLENEITFKNNIATTTVESVLGYGGKAVGYANYDYKDDIDKVDGAYCDTVLTVEGLESDRFIGNISEPQPIFTPKQDLTEEIYEKASVSITAKDGTIVTVYNAEELPTEYPIIKEATIEFDENAPKFTGFYDLKDLVAMNEFATANDLKKFCEKNGIIYFEDENGNEDGIYFDNLVYSDGDCVAFIKGDFSGGTLILASYIDNRLYSLTAHEVTGNGTYFVNITDSDDLTEVKAFLWSGLDTMTPMCETKTINSVYMLNE